MEQGDTCVKLLINFLKSVNYPTPQKTTINLSFPKRPLQCSERLFLLYDLGRQIDSHME